MNRVKKIERFRANKVSGQTFQAVENSSGPVLFERSLKVMLHEMIRNDDF